MESNALQFKRIINGSVDLEDNIIFDEVSEQGTNDIKYSFLDGTITIKKNGIYYINWWISAETNVATPSTLEITLFTSTNKLFRSGLTSRCGEVVGNAIINVESIPMIISLKNSTCGTSIFYNTRCETKAVMSLIEISKDISASVGKIGSQGPVGLAGVEGLEGLPGLFGQRGNIGDVGEKGEGGDSGIQGIKGPIGIIGEQGIQGIKGETGDRGIQGIKGPTGDKGIQGVQGIQGEQGDQGEMGLIGSVGPQGPRGKAGVDGRDGRDGNEGPRGQVGEGGLRGIDGEDGKRGIPGPHGPQGLQGEDGPQGLQGEEGPKGQRGDQGPVGRNGKDGKHAKDGQDGQDGKDGNDGQDGFDAQYTGIVGPVGLQGDRGPRGRVGVKGPTGPMGPTGIMGPKGPRANPVKLAAFSVNYTQQEPLIVGSGEAIRFNTERAIYGSAETFYFYNVGEIIINESGYFLFGFYVTVEGSGTEVNLGLIRQPTARAIVSIRELSNTLHVMSAVQIVQVTAYERFSVDNLGLDVIYVISGALWAVKIMN